MTERDLYLDDLEVGQSWERGPVTISEADIVAFARLYDPQPFHVDANAAAQTSFGGLIASGWQIAALTMREYVALKPFGGTAILGMGVDALRWLRPVQPDDALTIRWTLSMVRRSESRPDRGVVATAIEVKNQDGETVMTATTLAQVPTRLAS